MLTGRGAEDDLVTGLEGGADDYIPKTTSARELTVRIRALLRRAALREQEEGRINSGPQQSIEVGTLSLNPEARRVLVAGAPVSLTSLEFELLAALMKNRGRVRSREQLMNEVQDRKFDSFDRSIDVHIASLRRKLGDDSRSARFIRTVRGIGYVLVDPEQASP
jgi:DNA-binding response OmpR family regulator